MLINSQLEKNVYALDRPHFPLLPEFEDNVVEMDPDHPTSSSERAIAEAARATSPPVPRSKGEQMELIISTMQGMQTDIKQLLKYQDSLVRIMDNRFTTLNNKVDGLTKTVDELKKEVDAVPSPHTTDHDGESPVLHPGTQFKTQWRTPTVPAPEIRPTSSAPATAPSAPPAPPVSTPPP